METKQKTSKLNKILLTGATLIALAAGYTPKSVESFTGKYVSGTSINESIMGYQFIDSKGKERSFESLPANLEKGSSYEVVVKKPYFPIFANRTSYKKL